MERGYGCDGLFGEAGHGVGRPLYDGGLAELACACQHGAHAGHDLLLRRAGDRVRGDFAHVGRGLRDHAALRADRRGGHGGFAVGDRPVLERRERGDGLCGPARRGVGWPLYDGGFARLGQLCGYRAGSSDHVFLCGQGDGAVGELGPLDAGVGHDAAWCAHRGGGRCSVDLGDRPDLELGDGRDGLCGPARHGVGWAVYDGWFADIGELRQHRADAGHDVLLRREGDNELVDVDHVEPGLGHHIAGCAHRALGHGGVDDGDRPVVECGYGCDGLCGPARRGVGWSVHDGGLAHFDQLREHRAGRGHDVLLCREGDGRCRDLGPLE